MKPEEYKRRRRQLLREIGEGAIAVVPAAPESNRNRDVYYPYRQDSDFWYLSGFAEPEAVLVLVPGRAQGQYLLFCRERDLVQETWHGRRAGQQGAVEVYGADDSFPISDLDDILPGLMENKEKVFYTMGRYSDFDRQMMEWVNTLKSRSGGGIKAPNELVSLEYILHESRLYKSRNEASVMRKAARISAAAHKRAMRACKPGMWEYEIEAEFLHEFRRNGAEVAYPSIVGGGANGCILHYTENDAQLQDGDLLLVDAGAEYDGYASDITRTFPVNGEFSEAQREIYELVLESQLAAINVAVAGNHWNDSHEAVVKVLTQGLIQLGLLKGQRTKLIKEGAYRRFFMHRTGHWLGMDVHDVGDYKIDNDWRLLEPGMVMTVEPGLYITANRDIPKRFHNMGVRIEDDVLITNDGNEVLSRDVPKTVAEIENLMAKSLT